MGRTSTQIFLLVSKVINPPLLPLSANSGDGTSASAVVFGVIAAISPERVLSDFGPMVGAMEREGLTVRIRGADSYETFVRRVLDGSTYDMILTGGDTVQLIRDLGPFRPTDAAVLPVLPVPAMTLLGSPLD